MARFKVGDRVVAIDRRPGNDFEVGDAGTVVENRSQCPWVLFDRNIGSSVERDPYMADYKLGHMECPSEYQLKPETPKKSHVKFSKGDRVRVIYVDKGDSFEVGDVGVVMDESAAPYLLMKGSTYCATQDQLELLVAEEEPKPGPYARLTLVQAAKQLCERYGVAFDANDCMGTLETLIEAARNKYEPKTPESQEKPAVGAW